MKLILHSVTCCASVVIFNYMDTHIAGKMINTDSMCVCQMWGTSILKMYIILVAYSCRRAKWLVWLIVTIICMSNMYRTFIFENWIPNATFPISRNKVILMFVKLSFSLKYVCLIEILHISNNQLIIILKIQIILRYIILTYKEFWVVLV